MSTTATPGSSSNAGCLTGSAKLDEVTRLMEILTTDVHTNSLLPQERDAYLKTLKVYERDPKHSDPIFTKEGIETLAHYAFRSTSVTTSEDALRCLANAMLLRAETRQIFVDLGLGEHACNRLRNDSRNDEFLISRILFLTTYDAKLDLERMINQFHLAKNICVNLSRHAQGITGRSNGIFTEPMEEMALIETLKLMFNVSYYCPQRIGDFSAALKDLLAILLERPILETLPPDSLIWPLVNAIMNMELDRNVAIIFPEATPNIYVDHCVRILDRSTKTSGDQELEQEHNICSLILLLRKIYECAPSSTQSHMGQLLLPSKEDRYQILGRTESLSSRLLRLSSNPLTPRLRESIPDFLFELSGKDTQAFVQNVGYGYASGFLMKNNMPVPQNASETSGISEKNEGQTLSLDVNPVTGQFLEKEEKTEIEEMTEEEKEREAERLFVLFERLNKTGVISAQNFLEMAVQSGRVEERVEEIDSD